MFSACHCSYSNLVKEVWLDYLRLVVRVYYDQISLVEKAYYNNCLSLDDTRSECNLYSTDSCCSSKYRLTQLFIYYISQFIYLFVQRNWFYFRNNLWYIVQRRFIALNYQGGRLLFMLIGFVCFVHHRGMFRPGYDVKG